MLEVLECYRSIESTTGWSSGWPRRAPQRWCLSGASYFAYDEAGRLVGEYDANQAPLYETVYLGSMPVAVLKQAGTAASSMLSNVAYNVYSGQLDTPRVITSSADEAIRFEFNDGKLASVK
ncbi:hypothetical protein [Roseateles flavus]|uniref:Uncharacterized protein n=1 Tax=Roseateles flavus TaxID=3149041 RepID=A0ABV0GKK0_9BURK